MWGYRNQRYLYFGRFAARLDDVLNYIPARLSALSYAFLGNTKQAFQAWKNQTKQCESPNAGPVMASGAGALNLTLGGPAQYGGQWLQRPLLGYGLEPTANDIYRALRLVRHSVLLWLICLFIIVVASYA
jgi:adenosylcobinamide-phosphate synthase